MDFSMITKEYIRTHNFVTDGLSYRERTENVSYRLHPEDALPVALAESSNKLRQEFVKIFYDRFKGSYAKLQTSTGITEDAMRKYLRKEKGRPITRIAVAKLVVGIHLSIEEADKLFRLEGHSLEPESSLLDAIVVDALNCGDDIDIFYDTCDELKIKIS